jgi:hypothetical protein
MWCRPLLSAEDQSYLHKKDYHNQEDALHAEPLKKQLQEVFIGGWRPFRRKKLRQLSTE